MNRNRTSFQIVAAMLIPIAMSAATVALAGYLGLSRAAPRSLPDARGHITVLEDHPACVAAHEPC